VFGLEALLERATATPRGSADLPAGAAIDRISGGLAEVAVPIRVAEANLLESDGFHYTWQLPWPVSQDAAGDRTWPLLDVPGIEPMPVDVMRERVVQRRAPRSAPKKTDVWIDGSTLHVYGRQEAGADAEFLLHYPIVAARLVGGALGEDAPGIEELLQFRVETDEGRHLALALEAGTELRVPLAGFPGATLTGRLRATGPAVATSQPELTFETASEQKAQTEGSEQAVVTLQSHSAGPSAPGIELEVPAGAAPEVSELVLRASGPEGTLVVFEQPRLAFDAHPELERPNVLFVLLDTLRADRLGSYGNTDGLSPNLDRLAAESLVFDQCWSTSSWTMPSVSALMTGVHQEVHGGKHENSRINPALDTLAGQLSRAGYDSVAITEGGLFRGIYGHDHGFRRFFEHRKGIAHGVEQARVWYANEASAGGAAPWFMVLHSYEVHEPYEPDGELLEKIRAELPPELAKRITRPTDFAELYHAGQWTGEVSATVSEAMERLYDAEVRFADAQVGAFLDELRADGVLDDTLVVVTADHGEEFGEHGMIGHGDSLYPEQLHVPLMLRFPDGWRAGERETAPTSHIHLPPTILDAVGLGAGLEGTTFAGESMLRGPSDMPIYAWRYRDGERHLFALRVGDELVVEGEYDLARPEAGAPEIYDLGKDPGALANLAGDDPARLERLRALLTKVREAYSEGAFEGGRVQMDEATRAELEHLGYL